ncbi:MAG: apolipoprotein N-acyltransferase [Bacteroidales bacterium]|nr:apolipoprotein N-acyltransferase [Bacteroidales bacterium]
MKKRHLLLLSGLSGLLFTVGWPVNGYPAFLFTAFVPLLIIEDYILKNKNNFSRFAVFFYTYPAFFVWNILTTWWIWNSTPVATLAWGFNAMFMGMVMHVYHLARRNIYQANQGYFILPFLWITFEYIHLSWKLTWTWLNLGNGFSVYPKWVQWYEYTGTLGGTFWIIAINILIFKAFKPLWSEMKNKRNIYWNGGLALGLIIIPLFVSFLIYFSYKEKENPVNVIVTQPNLDPYSEQYSIPPSEVIDINLDLAESVIGKSTMFIVAPESAIQENIWEENLGWSPSLKKLNAYVQEYPNLKIIIGASSYRRYNDSTNLPSSVRYHKIHKFYYDAYNTAFYIDTTGDLQIHHKSRLTPGVEYMPSWGFLGFIENLTIDLGGTTGTLGIDPDPQPFTVNDSLRVGPIICYESIFGGFCRDYVINGANVLFIITNDGWWGNTPGHKQHITFASLRAIETRRSIARSANTGISCFVNQRGDIFQATNYWERDVIVQDMNLNSELTFYARFGDYFGRISAFISAIFILITIVFGIKKRKI